jgi:outer membrane protein OmpA-like peptidoglycan-associated protein
MLRNSARRRRRWLALLVLTALTGTVLALVPSTAQAMCRGAVARSCGVPTTITFPPLADTRVDHGPVALLATVSGAPVRVKRSPAPLPEVVYTSTTPSVCTIAGATAVLVAPGTCSVTADAPAVSYYLAADPETQAFQVLPLPEAPMQDTLTKATLTLRAPAGLPVSAGTATVKTVSDGTGKITLTSSSPKVCRVTGSGSVRLVQAGTCRLQATQAADAGHLAADPTTASFPVWSAPSLPARARSTEVLDVLGRGETGYRVVATPADVCRASEGHVVLIDGGVCHVAVRTDGDVVRTDKVKVVVPAQPGASSDSMDLGATVYFAFDSPRLSAAGKATLRKVAPLLRKADLVVVYGHTYGPGRNGPHSRALAAHRAESTVAFLDKLGVRSKTVSEVAMAMQQPVSDTPWKNRRAEIYYS